MYNVGIYKNFKLNLYNLNKWDINAAKTFKPQSKNVTPKTLFSRRLNN